MVVLQNKTLTEHQSNIIKKPEKHINAFQVFSKIKNMVRLRRGL